MKHYKEAYIYTYFLQTESEIEQLGEQDGVDLEKSVLTLTEYRTRPVNKGKIYSLIEEIEAKEDFNSGYVTKVMASKV